MIRLVKGDMPAVLKESAAAWTAEFLAARASGDVSDTIRYRYRNADVKGCLLKEAYGKCMYCEIKLAVGETDHFAPVAERPELIVDWPNLGLACKECNTNKGAYFSLTEPLINPFVDDPADHLLFFGPLIMGKAGDPKGFRTVTKIKLSRPDLLQRRAERVQRLQPLIQQWLQQPDGPTKDLVKEAILAECADSAEFAAIVRAYLYQELGWVYRPPQPNTPGPAPRAA